MHDMHELDVKCLLSVGKTSWKKLRVKILY